MSNILPSGESILAELGIDPTQIKSIRPRWKRAGYRAIINWLMKYQPPSEPSNMDRIRGLIETFYHLFGIKELMKSYHIYTTSSLSPDHQVLHEQLFTWSYYEEQVKMGKILFDNLDKLDELNTEQKGVLIASLGNAYDSLGKYQFAKVFHQKLLEISHQLQRKDFEAAALSNIGNVYYSLGDYHKAIDYYEKSLKIGLENIKPKQVCFSVNNLANSYLSIGQVQKAVECYQQGLTLACQLDLQSSEAGAKQGLGNCYTQLEKYSSAISAHQEAREIFQQIGNKGAEAVVLNDLGVAYKNSEQYQEAIKCYNESLSICREIGYRQAEATALGNLGNSYKYLGQYDTSISFQKKALEICHVICDRDGEGRAVLNLGNTYSLIDRIEESCLLFMKGLLIYDSLNISYRVDQIINYNFKPLIVFFLLRDMKLETIPELREPAIAKYIREKFKNQLEEIASESGVEAAEKIVQLLANSWREN